VPLIDPVSDMKIDDEELDKLIKQQQKMEKSRRDVIASIGMPEEDIKRAMVAFEVRSKLNRSIEML
jgi:phosphoribosyl-dephospho-CoA transferase